MVGIRPGRPIPSLPGLPGLASPQAMVTSMIQTTPFYDPNICKSPYKAMVSHGAVKYFQGMGVFESLEVVRTWQKMFFFSWVPQGCLVELCNERIGCDIFSAGISALSVKWRPIGVK